MEKVRFALHIFLLAVGGCFLSLLPNCHHRGRALKLLKTNRHTSFVWKFHRNGGTGKRKRALRTKAQIYFCCHLTLIVWRIVRPGLYMDCNCLDANEGECALASLSLFLSAQAFISARDGRIYGMYGVTVFVFVFFTFVPHSFFFHFVSSAIPKPIGNQSIVITATKQLNENISSLFHCWCLFIPTHIRTRCGSDTFVGYFLRFAFAKSKTLEQFTFL